MKDCVILLGSSAVYLDIYADLAKKEAKNLQLVVVDVNIPDRDIWPENVQVFAVAIPDAAAQIIALCEQRELRPVAVINRCDYYEEAHAKLTDHFQVAGPSSAAAHMLSNKAEFHQCMVEHGLESYRAKTKIVDFSEIETVISQFSYPIIVKGHAGSKSRGVMTLHSLAGLPAAKEKIAQILAPYTDKRVLVESFLVGKQVTPVAYVDHVGKVEIIALVDIATARDEGQQNLQIVYRTTPSQYSDVVRQKMMFVLQRLADVSGLRSTLLDPEFFVMGDDIYLIEVNVRMGGFRSPLFRPAYGIDLDVVAWELAFGKAVTETVQAVKSCTAAEIWDDRSGQITQFAIPEDDRILRKRYMKQVGDMYVAPPKKQFPLGTFYVLTENDSMAAAREIRAAVELEIITNK